MRTRPTSLDRTALDSAPAPAPAFGDPTRTGTPTPAAVLVDAVTTLLGLFLLVVAAGALDSLAPPFAAFVALWLVGLPTAFAAAVAVRAAVRVDGTARRLACARWNVGCEYDADAAV